MSYRPLFPLLRAFLCFVKRLSIVCGFGRGTHWAARKNRSSVWPVGPTLRHTESEHLIPISYKNVSRMCGVLSQREECPMRWWEVPGARARGRQRFAQDSSSAYSCCLPCRRQTPACDVREGEMGCKRTQRSHFPAFDNIWTSGIDRGRAEEKQDRRRKRGEWVLWRSQGLLMPVVPRLV